MEVGEQSRSQLPRGIAEGRLTESERVGRRQSAVNNKVSIMLYGKNESQMMLHLVVSVALLSKQVTECVLGPFSSAAP